ncbi:hypothetical protein KAT73_02235 [candidate division WOR-3 bacterium]|nr:hypothetical protein [candidate division WOR-3 bacterium]
MGNRILEEIVIEKWDCHADARNDTLLSVIARTDEYQVEAILYWEGLTISDGLLS